MIPYQSAVFTAAMLVVRFYQSHSPRSCAMPSRAGCRRAVRPVRRDVQRMAEHPGGGRAFVMVGVGQGALVTLLFNVLVTSSPKELAGDVGALRGTVNNLSAGVGTAIAGALVVGILSANIRQAIVDHPELPPSLVAQVDRQRDVRQQRPGWRPRDGQHHRDPGTGRGGAQINADQRGQ
ncbi:MAG: hypothetical protein U0802_15760 [Candidatus Binatia bacterium]